MKLLNNSINGINLKYLKSIIGNTIISYSHEPFDLESKVPNDFFGRVGLICSNGVFILDNRVDWLDDWFCSPDYIPHMVFNKVDKEESFCNYDGILYEQLTKYLVNELVKDIILIHDEIVVYKDGVQYENIVSTEGVIFVTDKNQYAFYKDNASFDEFIDEFKGDDVLSKLVSLQKHWEVFAKPYDGECTRSYIYLASGEKKFVDKVKIIGKVYND